MPTGTGADDPILEPGAALARLAAWKDGIDRLAADTGEMSDRLAELRATAADETGMAEVTVDARGALVDLRLDRRIQQVEPERVTQAIMSAIREAKRQLATRAQEIITATLGTDSPAARAIAAQVGERLGAGPAGEARGTP